MEEAPAELPQASKVSATTRLDVGIRSHSVPERDDGSLKTAAGPGATRAGGGAARVVAGTVAPGVVATVPGDSGVVTEAGTAPDTPSCPEPEHAAATRATAASTVPSVPRSRALALIAPHRARRTSATHRGAPGDGRWKPARRIGALPDAETGMESDDRDMRKALAALLVPLALGCSGASPEPTGGHAAPTAAGAAPTAAGATAPTKAVVDVAVATLWKRPRLLRGIDGLSAANPVRLREWLAGMTTDERRWLVGRLQTQASYGTKVTVLRASGRWTKVAVHGQPTPLNGQGYPGWLPTRQLTGDLSLPALLRTRPVAIVTRRTAWLRSPASFARRMEVSFGTRLPIVGEAGSHLLVARTTGGAYAVAKDAVAEYSSLRAVPRPSGRRIVATAKSFLGLPYLWAGTSGFGFDCSGLTYSVFRRFGIGMPRDADRQALHGRPVARSELRKGDLVFFGSPVHHVGIYAGGGTMVEAPETGKAVRVAPLRPGYASARRYL
jgi:gamma-D-glutamyl-L-lysine dipeptidyl-peptidase